MKNSTVFLALSVAAFMGWTAHDLLTPWNIRTQSSLFAWAEQLQAMNGVGRDGVLNGDPALFEARNTCLLRSELVQLLLGDREITGIYRCLETINGVDAIGELAVRISKDDDFSGYAVGFLPATDDPGMGEIARLGPY